MKLGVLFSGGKDSTLAAWLAKKQGHELICLITLVSSNQDSYMFHTPSISKTEKQAESIGLPLLIEKTKGDKELELKDLERAIKKAKEKYKIQGIVTGAVGSVYQASRIQKICDKLNLECFNPLWQKDQFELLEDLIKNKFEVIITGVAAYPLDGTWLGRVIDKKFIKDLKPLVEKYKINPAGEGGEFETFVLAAPGLFKKPLKVTNKVFSGEENSWRMEIDVK
ncbi:MAG: diphthine--ammonia ligase [Nanoarchaeota archaeon]|nr:diphthine--ammonia ligase [Nanoarchaeota archaeon]